MRRAAFFALLGALSLSAGDWLNRGGDAQHSGWQRRGKTIHTGNVGEIKLLWKHKLEGELSSPVMLGPIVTHRGIKELVFVQGSLGDVYAVDADLGRLFWRRHIESGAAGPCSGGSVSTPAMAPPPPGSQKNEDDDEGHTPMRPFYFVAGDGVLHTIRPADGVDMAPAVQFVPAHANLSALTFANGSVYATTSKGCGGAPDGMWSIDTTDPKAKASFVASTNGDAPVAFAWKGRTMLAAASGGGIELLAEGKLKSRVGEAGIRGIATTVDASGTRWVYAASDKKICGFRVMEDGLDPGWETTEAGASVAPVIANGVLYALGSTALYALDARTGKLLYTSGGALPSLAHPSALAVANGHICFSASETLFCFGLPIEIL